mgnify:CR=1 FL=1
MVTAFFFRIFTTLMQLSITIKIKVMSEQFIKAITIAIDKKMITADQGFEIIREQSAERTSVINETIGFNQKR